MANQLPLRLCVALLNAAGQLHLFLAGKDRYVAYFLKIGSKGVVSNSTGFILVVDHFFSSRPNGGTGLAFALNLDPDDVALLSCLGRGYCRLDFSSSLGAVSFLNSLQYGVELRLEHLDPLLHIEDYIYAG